MSTEEISVQEAAALLGVHVDTVYDLVRKGHLPARRLKPRAPWRIRRSALEPPAPVVVVEATPEK